MNYGDRSKILMKVCARLLIKMKLNLSFGEFVTAKDDDKFLVLGFRNKKLDSLGGRCTAKDMRRIKHGI
jgi:hypothetical protein